MKHLSFAALILILFSTTSCKLLSYSELPEPGIKTTKLKLKGWQGLSDKRSITFGEYYTKNHRRGDNLSNTPLFFPSLTQYIAGAKKVHFQQYIPTGDSSTLYAFETLKRKGIKLHELRDVENANHVIFEHKIRGEIQFEKDNSACFEIDLISDQDQYIFKEGGFEKMQIRFFQYDENDKGRERTVVGTDFLLDNKIVAAYRQGKDGVFEYENCWVWIQNDLGIDEQLVLASLISLLADQSRVDIHGKL